jgi:uncharacterized integral membrane protein
MVAALILILLLLALVATVAVQNPGILAVRFLHLSVSTSLVVVVFVAFAAGVLVGLLCAMPSLLRRRRKVRELAAEVAALRKAPAPLPPERP